MSSIEVRNIHPSMKEDKEIQSMLDLAVENGAKPVRIHLLASVSLAQSKSVKQTRGVIIGAYRMSISKMNFKSLEATFSLTEIERVTADESVVVLHLKPDPKAKPSDAGRSFEFHGEVAPVLLQRLREARDMFQPLPTDGMVESLRTPLPAVDRGPGNGFLEHYYALCDARGTAPSAVFAAHVRALVARPEPERYVLDYREVQGLLTGASDLKCDPVPVIEALAHNDFFRSVTLDSVPKTLASSVCYALSTARSLRTVRLTRTEGFAAKAAQPLLEALTQSPAHRIDLGETQLGTVGPMIAKMVQTRAAPLTALSLNGCKLSNKCVAALADGLAHNYAVSLGIVALDLSGNALDGVASKALAEWLQAASSMKLQVLRLSATKPDMGVLCEKLTELPDLRELDVSHNKVDSNAAAVLAVLAKQSKTLTHLNIASCMLGDSVAQVLSALGGNAQIHALLTCGDNKTSAKALAKELSKDTPGLNGLDLSLSKFKPEDAEAVLKAIHANHSLRLLTLDHFLAKPPTPALCTLLHDTLPKGLTALALRGGWKGLNDCLSAAGKAKELKEIDLTGAALTDEALVPLVQSLGCEGAAVERVYLEGNEVSTVVLFALASALRVNRTLVHVGMSDSVSKVAVTCAAGDAVRQIYAQTAQNYAAKKLKENGKECHDGWWARSDSIIRTGGVVKWCGDALESRGELVSVPEGLHRGDTKEKDKADDKKSPRSPGGKRKEKGKEKDDGKKEEGKKEEVKKEEAKKEEGKKDKKKEKEEEKKESEKSEEKSEEMSGSEDSESEEKEESEEKKVKESVKEEKKAERAVVESDEEEDKKEEKNEDDKQDKKKKKKKEKKDSE